MRDFTFHTYKLLLEAIQDSGYEFQTMEEFIEFPKPKVVIMRHDCDLWPENDLKISSIENSMNIVSTYYFRMPYTFNKEIIGRIRDLGHEIGYHYENLAECNGDYKASIEDFKSNLNLLRDLYPVRTAAMHGRPMSKWDNRLLWDKYDFQEFGIIAEPYLSVDYDKVLYLTDTGNMWNGNKVSIRDTVKSKLVYNIATTFDLIKSFQKRELPEQIIINSHGDRWNDNLAIWVYKDLVQKLKNIAKRLLKIIRS